MWLALAGSNRNEPAAFFRQLLVSMPSEPECPIVVLRRWLVDLFDRGDSSLLSDIDGEEGLLSKIVSHGSSLGVRDVRPSLHLLGAGLPAGEGWQRWRRSVAWHRQPMLQRLCVPRSLENSGQEVRVPLGLQV